jgi:hypothetical protein
MRELFVEEECFPRNLFSEEDLRQLLGELLLIDSRDNPTRLAVRYGLVSGSGDWHVYRLYKMLSNPKTLLDLKYTRMTGRGLR